MSTVGYPSHGRGSADGREPQLAAVQATFRLGATCLLLGPPLHDLGGSPDTWLQAITVVGFSCRIDHHLATPGIAAKPRAESISIHLAQRSGDHAPLIIDCDFRR